MRLFTPITLDGGRDAVFSYNVLRVQLQADPRWRRLTSW
jgi:hypothetical protein